MICTTLGHTFRVSASIDSFTRSSASGDGLFCGTAGTGFCCAVATADGTASVQVRATSRRRVTNRARLMWTVLRCGRYRDEWWSEMHFRRAWTPRADVENVGPGGESENAPLLLARNRVRVRDREAVDPDGSRDAAGIYRLQHRELGAVEPGVVERPRFSRPRDPIGITKPL